MYDSLADLGINRQNKNTLLQVILHGNIRYTHGQSKAELLNNYFISQTILPPSNLPLPPFTYLTHARLDQIDIDHHKVKQQLLTVNTSKASGPDSISNRVLKECAESLYLPLTNLFQKSLDEGTFPDPWKDANVSSIFKKLARNNKTNYRPISLLACVSKIFEKLVFDVFFKYLVTNKLLSDKNSGFMPNDSAVNRLLVMFETIYKNFDSNQDTVFLSLDVSKAFDRVWHEGLIFKLKQLGISGNLLKWFKSYLTNRRQRVILGGHNSTYKHIHAGVPQSSILGPLLFLIYVSDMTTGLLSDVHQYADDTSLLITVKDPLSALHIINHDLVILQKWADQWRVTFNPSKTNFMTLSLKKPRLAPIPITWNNVAIEESTEFSILGVTIVNDMTWGSHILKLISKASKRLYVLRKYRDILPRKALETIYISMIRPILEYGDVLYNSMPLSTG